ncbi:MAG: hypothetical protein Q4A00_06105 [Flavobacteriaceae bacterium]|nr:hypothetical protein [Flavobacteriaceae bacterium]
MRLNNKHKTPVYRFFFTLVTIILIVGLGMSFLNFVQLPVLGKRLSYGAIIFGVLMYAIIYIRGRQIFEYDSDGEALNFKNYNVLSFLESEARDEFPKYKLISYEIVNAILFKRLYIRIKSKKKNASTLKYDISYLSRKEIRDLRTSLNKVIKYNNENRIYENQ